MDKECKCNCTTCEGGDHCTHPDCHTPQNNWEERFEEEAPLAYGGREWAKNFIREALASQRETLAVSLDEKAEEYKLKKRETPFQDTLFNHAVNVLTDAAEIVRKFKG